MVLEILEIFHAVLNSDADCCHIHHSWNSQMAAAGMVFFYVIPCISFDSDCGASASVTGGLDTDLLNGLWVLEEEDGKKLLLEDRQDMPASILAGAGVEAGLLSSLSQLDDIHDCSSSCRDPWVLYLPLDGVLHDAYVVLRTHDLSVFVRCSYCRPTGSISS